MYRPLGRRVLVKPDPADTETAGGLVIPDKAQDHTAMSGVVVALGPECAGPSYRIKTDVLVHVDHAIERAFSRAAHDDAKEDVLAEIRALLAEYYNQHAEGLQVGMGVAFPYTVGTLFDVEGEPMLLLNEADIVAAWMPDAATVETAA